MTEEPRKEAAGKAGAARIPLAEEQLHVGRRVVERGRVRVALTTEYLEQTIRETLHGTRAEVERVPFGHEVSEVPATRHEGDVLVVPVVEEVLVVERRLVLKEEIRIRLVPTEEVVEEPVERRVQHATVTRTASASEPSHDPQERNR